MPPFAEVEGRFISRAGAPSGEAVSVASLQAMKAAGRPIAALTAYDALWAVYADRSGVEVVLVGDTLGLLVLGHRRIEDTTLDEMILHGRSVARGVRRALVVVDMPSGTYEVSADEARHNATRLVRESGAGVVKLEGGTQVAGAVRAVTRAGIPVFAHLTPHHEESENGLALSAQELERAGAVALVLVGVPSAIARRITDQLAIPTLGYRSGPYVDGQLAITPVLLGLVPPDEPQSGLYGQVGRTVIDAVASFADDVHSGRHEAVGR